MEVTGFDFDGVGVNIDGDSVEIADEYSAVITSKENMTQISIQWLALHNPEALAEGE